MERAKRGKYGVAVAQKGWTFKPFTLFAEEEAYGGGADDVIATLAKRIADKAGAEGAGQGGEHHPKAHCIRGHPWDKHVHPE